MHRQFPSRRVFLAGLGAPPLARARDIAALFLFEAGMTLGRVGTGGIGDVLT